MGDEDVTRLERQIDGLLGQYGALMQTQIRHDERIDEAKTDRAEIRSELAKVEQQLLAALGRSEQRTREHIERVDKSCQDFREEYRRDRAEARKRQENTKVSNRTLVAAMIAGSFTVLAAIIGAAAVVLTGG